MDLIDRLASMQTLYFYFYFLRELEKINKVKLFSKVTAPVSLLLATALTGIREVKGRKPRTNLNIMFRIKVPMKRKFFPHNVKI